MDSALFDDCGRRRHQVRVRRVTRPEPCRPERPVDGLKFAVRSKRRVAAAIRQNTRPRVTAMTGGACPFTATVEAGAAAAAAAAGGTATLGAFFSRVSSRSLRSLRPLRC